MEPVELMTPVQIARRNLIFWARTSQRPGASAVCHPDLMTKARTMDGGECGRALDKLVGVGLF